MKLFVEYLVMLLAAAWLGGCGTDKLQLDYCKKPEDCAEGFVCRHNRCVEYHCTSECDKGYWCNADGACVSCSDDAHCGANCTDCAKQPTNQRCLAGVCGCLEDTDCAPGKSCEEGYKCTGCVPDCTGKCGGASDGCSDVCNGDCPTGQWCEDFACIACESATRCGQDCFDCSTLTNNRSCVEGACGCFDNEDCESEKTCNIDLHLCEHCEPDCRNRQCGYDPNCGQSCGDCADPLICNSRTSQCECRENCCGQRICGIDPICGLGCGICGEFQSCNIQNGRCEPDCTPNCAGRNCGPDPLCGQSCGQCQELEVCSAGRCQQRCIPDCTLVACGSDPLCGFDCGPCPETLGIQTLLREPFEQITTREISNNDPTSWYLIKNQSDRFFTNSACSELGVAASPDSGNFVCFEAVGPETTSMERRLPDISSYPARIRVFFYDDGDTSASATSKVVAITDATDDSDQPYGQSTRRVWVGIRQPQQTTYSYRLDEQDIDTLLPRAAGWHIVEFYFESGSVYAGMDSVSFYQLGRGPFFAPRTMKVFSEQSQTSSSGIAAVDGLWIESFIHQESVTLLTPPTVSSAYVPVVGDSSRGNLIQLYDNGHFLSSWTSPGHFIRHVSLTPGVHTLLASVAGTAASDSLIITVPPSPSFTVATTPNDVTITRPEWSLTIGQDGRWVLAANGSNVWPASDPDPNKDPRFYVDLNPVHSITLLNFDDQSVRLQATYTPSGLPAQIMTLVVVPLQNAIKLGWRYATAGEQHIVRFQTPKMTPAFGLGEPFSSNTALASPWPNANINIDGYDDNYFATGWYANRLQWGGDIGRNKIPFLIFPKNRFAEALFDPRPKVFVTSDRHVIGFADPVEELSEALVFFVGEPREIYAAYKQIREEFGFSSHLPKENLFHTGWETWFEYLCTFTQDQVLAALDLIRTIGAPAWTIVGSGFWEGANDACYVGPVDLSAAAADSFIWNSAKFPDPGGFLQAIHDQGMIIFGGVRKEFSPQPRLRNRVNYTKEGQFLGYYARNDLAEQTWIYGSEPTNETYLVDPYNDRANQWYLQLNDRYGLDGMKEDNMSPSGQEWVAFGPNDEHVASAEAIPHRAILTDDRINSLFRLLTRRGQNHTSRNEWIAQTGMIRIPGWLGSGFPHDQALNQVLLLLQQFSATGHPFSQAEINSGTCAGSFCAGVYPPAMEFVRATQAQVFSPSYTFAYLPRPERGFTPELLAAMQQAVSLRERLFPYLWDAVVDSYRSGYPGVMTPLFLAYPDDIHTHSAPGSLVQTTRDSFNSTEWLFGPSILVAPLTDTTSFTRSVYLPAGLWRDWHTGQIFQGPTSTNKTVALNEIPLYVGGTGIWIEKGSPQNNAHVFPAAAGVYRRYMADQTPNGLIILEDALTLAEFGQLNAQTYRVFDTTAGRDVAFSIDKNDLVFPIEDVHTYVIRRNRCARF